MESYFKLDVTCIIINFNSSKYTINCINSIIKNTKNKIEYEIIIVDNSSQLNDFKNLSKEVSLINKPFIKIIRNKKNIGFGSGNMLGVKHSKKSVYYAFINNDTLMLTNETLSELKKFMDKNFDVGICSPQTLDENKKFKVTIDHFSSLQREILGRTLLEKLFPKKYLNRKSKFKKPTAVNYVQGSFLFCRAKYFNNVGGFDPNLFLYYEESDISLRMLKELNKKTYIIPHLEYIHYKGKSSTYGIKLKIEQKLSLMYYTEKHQGWLSKKLLIIYYSIRYFFTSIIKPKYWALFYVLIIGAPMSKSMRNKK